MSKVKKIVLTGGGTAGHVTPNIALLPELKNKGTMYIILVPMRELNAH